MFRSRTLILAKAAVSNDSFISGVPDGRQFSGSDKSTLNGSIMQRLTETLVR